MFNRGRFNQFRFDGPILGGSGPPPPPALDLKQAIVEELEASAALAAIVGTEIYPSMIPQTASLPAISYGFQHGGFTMHLAGSTGMRWTLVEFEFEANLLSDIEAINRILINRFVGFIGDLDGIKVQFVTYEDEADGYYEPLEGSDLGTHWKRIYLLFKTRDPIPTNV
jgi:hypothetical protein